LSVAPTEMTLGYVVEKPAGNTGVLSLSLPQLPADAVTRMPPLLASETRFCRAGVRRRLLPEGHIYDLSMLGNGILAGRVYAAVGEGLAVAALEASTVASGAAPAPPHPLPGQPP